MWKVLKNNFVFMKKLFVILFVIASMSATPALAAAKKAAVPKKPAWETVAPADYYPISWASAPGIASFFKPPSDNGAIDFLTRINLQKNQINFIISPEAAAVTPDPLIDPSANTTGGDISAYPILSFKRIVAEASKAIDPAIKFIWDAPFFNMGLVTSDLSMAVKYTVGDKTIVSGGTRSAADLSLPRRMLVINNKTGKAIIQDFDQTIFTDPKSGDTALEGFSPSVGKTDGPNGAASRLFLGVSDDGQGLAVYCSRSASVKEAGDALIAAGIAPGSILQADGGGSTSCGYNLPGQFFVEPARTLPMLMGAKTIMLRAKVTSDTLNVRSGPGTKYSIVSKLSKGDAITAYGELSGWYRIGDGRWVIKTMVK
jgi:hypothetical protein